MSRRLREWMAVFVLVGLALAGWQPAGSMRLGASHAAAATLADCPHAGPSSPSGDRHGHSPAPAATAPCCSLVFTTASAATPIARLSPERSGRPFLASERVPAGATPGPELPPPRA